MQQEASHKFDRRQEDVNVKSVAERVKAIEDHVHGAMMPELRANTILTKQMHARTEEMWEIFETTRNGFRVIASVGNAGMKVVEVGGKLAKPLLWIGALGAAIAAYFKSGHFQIPPWP